MNDYIIEMENITKEFPGVLANDRVTLQLRRGEVHALLGENGAGKSTLMSILFGLYQPDSGVIRKNGQVVQINNPNDANALKIGMVHQHFKLVEVFTVLENIFLGVEPVRLGVLKYHEARQHVIDLSQKYGLRVEPDARIEDITVGMQQRVEILKMLYRDNEILIFDEPTAVLTPQEIKELMATILELKAEGKSILFISHKLNEIMQVSDRCTVLRKGQYIGTVDVDQTSVEELSHMMVGRPIQLEQVKKVQNPGKVVLDVQDLVVPSKLHKNNAVRGVTFQVREGEIVCLAGVDGNGQSELVYALTGIEKPVAGSIRLKGQDITNASIRERSRHGVSHIPEDRHKYGLILDYSLADNLVLQRYWEPRFQHNGLINQEEVQIYAGTLITQYDIRAGQGAQTIVRSMSGGNQQKAIIAREIDKSPELLVAMQPTRGLDVGAVEYILTQLILQRDSGKAVLLVSFELEEVMNVSDRILVMYEGELVGEFNPQETSVEELGLYMAGARRNQMTGVDNTAESTGDDRKGRCS